MADVQEVRPPHNIVLDQHVQIDAGISDVLYSLEHASTDELLRAVCAWMDSAAQFCRNEAYWRERCRSAETVVKAADDRRAMAAPDHVIWRKYDQARRAWNFLGGWTE